MDPTETSTVEPAHQRVLVPEILDEIFKRSSTPDLAALVRVCQSWSELALDSLWEDRLPSLFPLLKILTPLVNGPDGRWTCPRGSLGNANWNKFRLFASRVRVLRHADTYDDGGSRYYALRARILSTEYLIELQENLPEGFGPILPQLRHLEWTVRADIKTFIQSLVFLPPSLKRIIFSTDSPADQLPHVGLAKSQTLRFIATHPSLAHLRLDHFAFPLAFTEVPELVAFLRGQTTIQTLQLLGIPGDSTAVQAIADLPNLRDLDLWTGFNSVEETHSFLSSLSYKALPTLTRIKLELNSINVSNVFPLPFLGSFQPLLRLQGMTVVDLSYVWGIGIVEEDIVAMGQAWPHLKILRFNLNLHQITTYPLHLLPIVARSFTHTLQEFGLPVSFDEVPELDPSATPFSSLKVIDFGNFKTPRGNHFEVANLLSRICPPGVEIRYEVLPHPDRPWEEAADRQKWEALKMAVREAHSTQIRSAEM